jgi:hypothetical protein
MDGVRKPNISGSDTPSSESYSNYLFLRNVRQNLPDCAASYPRRQFHSFRREKLKHSIVNFNYLLLILQSGGSDVNAM